MTLLSRDQVTACVAALVLALGAVHPAVGQEVVRTNVQISRFELPADLRRIAEVHRPDSIERYRSELEQMFELVDDTLEWHEAVDPMRLGFLHTRMTIRMTREQLSLEDRVYTAASQLQDSLIASLVEHASESDLDDFRRECLSTRLLNLRDDRIAREIHGGGLLDLIPYIEDFIPERLCEPEVAAYRAARTRLLGQLNDVSPGFRLRRIVGLEELAGNAPGLSESEVQECCRRLNAETLQCWEIGLEMRQLNLRLIAQLASDQASESTGHLRFTCAVEPLIFGYIGATLRGPLLEIASDLRPGETEGSLADTARAMLELLDREASQLEPMYSRLISLERRRQILNIMIRALLIRDMTDVLQTEHLDNVFRDRCKNAEASMTQLLEQLWNGRT